jgi:hypothetical protein
MIYSLVDEHAGHALAEEDCKPCASLSKALIYNDFLNLPGVATDAL